MVEPTISADYDVETGQRTAPVVKPQDWEEYDLGVVLKVTPVVDVESNTIDLDLQPEITKFLGYDNYLVGITCMSRVEIMFPNYLVIQRNW